LDGVCSGEGQLQPVKSSTPLVSIYYGCCEFAVQQIDNNAQQIEQVEIEL